MRRIVLLSLAFIFLGSALTAQRSFSDRLSIRKSKVEKVGIEVFPNPAVDQIKVKNAAKVSKLILFNVVGREMKRFNVSEGKSYSIRDLPNGMYLVQILDKQEKIITTQRLTKR
ncbi:MAG: T9SS type A sorting domain-containing protein [Bacteroidota bacterium]